MTTITNNTIIKKMSLIVAANIALAVAPFVNANEGIPDDEEDIEEIQVTATDQSLNDVAQPVRVFSQEDIHSHHGHTVGELLSNLPGVSNASYGAGVGRPVIRGLTGNRVKMTVNGADSADISAMSSDHAPMVEAVNAKQLEIIYGPSTLRFGSSAMGGVVNMADSRFHEIQYEGSHGHLATSASTADNGTNLNAIFDAGHGPWVLHVDGFSRQTENYRAGNDKDINNTMTSSEGVNLGLNYVAANGNSIGLAVSALEYEYGVPNPDNDPATVDPVQNRFDAQAIIQTLPSWLDQVKTKFTRIDYEHGESFANTVVGLFDKTSTEFSTTLRWADIAGWQSTTGIQYLNNNFDVCHDHGGCDSIPDYSRLSWNGDLGNNLDSDTNSGWMFSHDTPMPLTESIDLGAYLIAETEWEHGLIELGARVEQRSIAADPVSIRPSYRQDQSYYDDREFDSLSLSSAVTWQLEHQKIGLSLARSQRAPTADELYWNGDHHATFSFQLDNPNLDTETSQSLDLTWNLVDGALNIQGAVFYYDFEGYIYNDLKSVVDPFHGNPVYRHEQQDAWISGAELQIDFSLDDQWQVFAGSDVVKAQLKSGANKNLPRTPPFTFMSGIEWQKNAWRVSSDVKYFAEQTDVTATETSTDAYFVLNGYVSYTHRLNEHELQVYLRGHNLTDEFGRNHVSYLKQFSPVIGRNINLGLNYSF